MSEVISYLPEIGAALGYGAGQVGETVARHTITQIRIAILGAYEGVEGNAGRQGLLRRGVAKLAIIGAITGFAAGEAAAPADHIEAHPPVLATVVDHSFQTGQSDAFKQLNTVAKSVNQSHRLRSEFLLAHNGGHDAVKTDKAIASDIPYGPASVGDTVTTAIEDVYNNSGPIRTNSLRSSDSTGRSGGVLILTDGNSAGKAEDVIRQAKDQGNIPLYVANSGDNTIGAAMGLKMIAKQTGGKYWSINKNNAAEVASQIKQEIKPSQISEKVPKDRLPLEIIAIAAAALGIKEFFRRKSETAIS